MSEHIDPKLKAALAEIEQIMEKHDCGGIISLHSKTHTEYKFVMPKWSLITFAEPNPDGKTVQVDVKHRGKSNPEDTVATYHLMFDAQHVCEVFVEMFAKLRAFLESVPEIGKIETVPFKDR